MSTYHVPHLFDTEHTDAFKADRQGDLTDQERADRALINFVKDVDFTTATYLEGCIHCGLCAEACHFHEMTGNPIYTPIWKLEPFKQAYKREASPLSFVYKALNLKRKVTASELEQWQHLIYDSCTICGRCSMICPMGIDIASLILKARHAMYHAGLVPEDLWEMARKQEQEGSPMGVTAEKLNEIIASINAAGATNLLDRLPDGIDSLLGSWFSGGTELSGGEWQRLSLARAVVRDARILLLDEPTSAMDSWAETDWVNRFRALAAGRTAIIISHRLTTAMKADVIHVMDRGRIIESGSHEELLRKGGRYAEAWRAQMEAAASNYD